MVKKTAADYEKDIISLHSKLPDKKIEGQVLRRINKWISMAPLRVQVANNEQTPWSADNIGFQTEPMPTKNTTDINQVCDYIGVIATESGDRYVDIAIERKSTEDLYGTLVPEDGRARFYREIDRFDVDKRFNQMVIIVEGTLSDFILYQPAFDKTGFNYKRRFDTKKNGSINEKKLTVLSDIMGRGVMILFADNPVMAANMCGRLFRQSLRKRYDMVLDL